MKPKGMVAQAPPMTDDQTPAAWEPPAPPPLAPPEPPAWPPQKTPDGKRRSTPRLAFLGALFLAGGLAGFGVASGVAITHNSNTGPLSSLSQSGTTTNPSSPSNNGNNPVTPPSGQSSGQPASPDSIAASIDPAVVDINGTLSGGGQVSGTGQVLTSSGIVLTNNHVIEGTTSLSLQVDGAGQTYTATVLGTDVADDIALLQMNGASNLKTINIGDSSTVQIGDSVVAIGNALGRGGTPQATSGSVTALNQTITAGDSSATAETLNGTIEVNAFIQPGDSGGPLVDANGRVIGIDTAAQSSGRFGSQTGSNVGFAIPINSAMDIARQIEAGRASSNVQIGTRGVLGVEVSTTQSGSGAVVNGVQSGSPAGAAGIATGSVITSINGQSVSGPAALSTALLGKHPGDSVNVGWNDASGGHHAANITLEAGPPA